MGVMVANLMVVARSGKKATLKRCGTSNTFSLTILPLGCNIVEGTTMEWKLRKEHRREDSKQWYRYSRWFPKTVTPPPSSCCVTVPYPYWHYHIPPLDKLKGEFQLLPDRRPDVLIVIRWPLLLERQISSHGTLYNALTWYTQLLPRLPRTRKEERTVEPLFYKYSSIERQAIVYVDTLLYLQLHGPSTSRLSASKLLLV